MPSKTRQCVGCGRWTYPERSAKVPGMVRYKAKGLCTRCYKAQLPLTKPTNLHLCDGCHEMMVPAGRVDKLGKFKQHHARGICTECWGVERRADAATGTD